MVPSLAIFLVSVETDFYDRYREYYGVATKHGTLRQVLEAKRAMTACLREGLRRTLVVQGPLTLLLMVLAPWIAPWDPNRPAVRKILDAPSKPHPLGTDQLGRDVLSRMLYGARVSLAVGFVSVGIATMRPVLTARIWEKRGWPRSASDAYLA